jgi:hypothetical protein
MEVASAINGHVAHHLRYAPQISLSGDAPDILTRIFDTQIKLCIYKRAMNTGVQEYVAFLQQIYQDLRITQAMSLNQSVGLLSESLPQHRCRQYFIDDVLMVTEMFVDLFGLEQVGFRLCMLNKAMCPRFHTDKVPCRLITTYSGKGTEWLDSRSVSPEMLEVYNEKPACTDFVRRLSPGDISLFKGDAWSENSDPGVVHRSPALNADETRLLLTLDFSC